MFGSLNLWISTPGALGKFCNILIGYQDQNCSYSHFTMKVFHVTFKHFIMFSSKWGYGEPTPTQRLLSYWVKPLSGHIKPKEMLILNLTALIQSKHGIFRSNLNGFWDFYQCCAGITFTQIYPLGMDRVYCISST
jgi:hypothetical protein